MANIPFASYPSFANVTRYEHSLGTAHLAWRFAERNGLPEDEGTALTLAALYHDGATPAYGHLYEELLARTGFDHEQALVDLLTNSLVTSTKQVFLGRRCRLPEELPRTSPTSLLSCEGVVAILSGQHVLSELIAGEIDVDNIDNVVRAATAMGIVSPLLVHPHDLVDSLTLDAGRLCRTANGQPFVNAWIEVRQRLYGSILSNAYEFRAQSATKWAIEQAALADPELLEPESWSLTEPELAFGRLRRDPAARGLIDSVRLGRPPKLLFSAEVSDVSALMGSGSGEVLRSITDKLSSLVGRGVYLNFYLDKAQRSPRLPISMQQSSLFGARVTGDHGPVTARTTAGVVGAVSLSSTQFRPEALSRPRLHRRHTLTEKELGEVLSHALGVDPGDLAPSGWVRSDEAIPQASLFP